MVSAFLVISVLIVNLKQQEIHRGPQAFRCSHMQSHTCNLTLKLMAIMHTAPPTAFHVVVPALTLNEPNTTVTSLLVPHRNKNQSAFKSPTAKQK